MRSTTTLAGMPVALIVSLFGTANAAVQIDQSAFGGNQTVEGFEGFSVGPNSTQDLPGFGLLTVGKLLEFGFGSGVSLTAPIPNTNADVGVLDESIGPIGWGLGANGSISSSADLPSGLGCFVMDILVPSFELTFDEPQVRVGAFVTGAPGTNIMFEAFNEGGASLGSVSIAPVVVGDWPTNFLGVQDLLGIKRIVVSGDTVVMDELMFEAPNVWTEVGDAGQNGIDEAQLTWGPGLIDAIEGEISNNFDVDVYCIRITDEANFSATTLGGGSFDTTLYLFDVAGNGVVFNDDVGPIQSTINSQLVVTNGVYFLAISSFGAQVNDGSNTRARDELGGAIFSYPAGGGAQVGPNPCGGPIRPDCNAISGRLFSWGAGGQSSGQYTIRLSGATFCANRCPSTLHVPGSFATIADAIAASVDGDTILVAPGVHAGSNLNPGGRQITIRSQAGPARTTIENLSGRVFFIGGDIGPLCRVEGFTITGVANALGTGAFVTNGAAPLFVDCHFANSQTLIDGAGAFAQNEAAPIFDRCEFRENSAFVGGGAELTAAAFGRFVSCLFAGNQAQSSGNAMSIGLGSGAEIFGCTFVANTGGTRALAVNSDVVGANNVFFDNGGNTFSAGFDPNVQFSYSLFPGGTGTNIDVDPQFLDAIDGDYRLGAGSPAIDAGDCSLMPPGSEWLDLRGEDRVQDTLSILDTGPACAPFGVMDMGCYEASPGAPDDCPGDANGDGMVNFSDVTTVLGNWLAVCP